ncbi:MAG: hypothetical protein JW809_02370 [Pirellulales bacterium]|nr:hypothetical protein [Pirellulales bacterium]
MVGRVTFCMLFGLCAACAALWGVSARADDRPTASEPPAAQAEKTDVAEEDADPETLTVHEVKLLAIEKNVVRLTNEERARRGLPPLKVDHNLMKSAREHAIWMTRSRRLQHTRHPVAENIAMGYANSLAVVRGWMNSSGHRANILNGSHRRIGVAAYVTESGTIYWCQQFRR